MIIFTRVVYSSHVIQAINDNEALVMRLIFLLSVVWIVDEDEW